MRILQSPAVHVILALSLVACVSPGPPEARSAILPEDARIAEKILRGTPLNAESWVGQGKLPWGLPVRWPTEKPVITEFFGWRKKSRRKERLHDGVDLKAAKNSPIFAMGNGEVIYASRRMKNYGKMVVIDHGHGWSSVYAHLNAYKVKVGDQVVMGELIGLSGKTGRAFGPHLHFEIRLKADPLDPILFLPKVPTTKSGLKY